MDNEELVSYYLKKSQDWIFIPKFRNIKIEDDEILDLDSMDLDNNEDTWLYSSSEKSFLNDSQKSMEHEELEKEFGSANEIESKKEKDDISYSPLSPLLGPEDFQHPSFLNSMDEMSDSAFEDLLRTPITSRSKSNLLRKALSNNHSRTDFNITANTASGGSVSGSFSRTAATVAAASETVSNDEVDLQVFKKPATTSAPPASESVAKSYILHSVENKLFSLADVNAGPAELVKNRDLKNTEIGRKSEKITPDSVDALCHRFEEMRSDGGDGGGGVNDENALTMPPHTYKWHSTPQHETANKPPPRRSFPQQPTPILLNRYLKHRHLAAETDTVHHLHVEADDGAECEHNGEVYGSILSEKQLQPQRNEMNVSFVKYESEDSSKLPRIEDAAQNGLRSTFSKSDDVLNTSNSELNSTYSLVVEDDAASTASESSLSSMGNNKLTLSIQEVQKMADLQERSLKKQVYSSYYAGSSKSSEVSSSNESVSTYGALSNSNEGSIDTKPTPKIIRGIQPPKQRLSYARNPPSTCNSKTNSRISTLDRTCGKINVQPSKLAGNVGGKSMSAPANEIRPSTAYRSRISTSNGQHLNTSQSPVRKTQISTTRPSTVPSKLIIPAESTEDIVSVKEIKNMNTSNGSSNAGPGSHIPRPASKIPMFRTRNSQNMMHSTLLQQREIVKQLRKEAALKRILISQAVQDILSYIQEHSNEDCLLKGFSSQKANPFREKSSCAVL